MVNDTRAYFGHTEKKACNLIGISRSSYRYIPQLPCDDTLKERMRDLAYKKPRYGVRRLHTLLKKEGLVVNHKKTERIYRQEGLAIRIKTKKKLPHFVKEQEMVTVLDQQSFEDTHEGWRDRLILELLYGTGMRLSELINLKENQINLHERTIKVLGKRNKERVIPFSDSLVTIIQGYRAVRNRHRRCRRPAVP